MAKETVTEEVLEAGEALADGPIEMTGGSSPVTFDEIEALDAREEAEVKVEAEKAVKVEKVKDEIIKSEKKASKEEKAAAKEEKEVKEAKEEVEAEIVEQVKKYMAKVGDEELELRADTAIPVKIDGEDYEITLEDLRSNFSGKVSYDKKFSSLSKEKKQFETQRSTINRRLEELYNTSPDDPFGAFLKMAQWSGRDPVKLQSDILDQLLPEVQKLAEMTDDEREVYKIRQENDILKRMNEMNAKTSQQERQNKELMTRVIQLREEHEISEEEFAETYFEMEKAQEEGDISIPNITADDVANVIINNRLYDSVEVMLANIDEDLAQDDDIIDDMVKIKKDFPDLSMDELKDVAEQAFSSRVSGELSKRTRTKKQPVTEAVNPNTDMVNFDDLME